MERRPAFDDLVGRPYKAGGTDPAVGVDCLWTAREALRRIFPDMRADEMPITAEEVEAAVAGATRLPRWRIVARAHRLGDMFHVERPGGGTGVAVLVDPTGGVVLTALPGRGVVLLSSRRLGRIINVWRRRP